MKKTVLIYGALLAILVILLRVLEYRFLVRDLSVEVYIGMIAIFFTSLGIWFGLKLIDRQKSKAISQSGLDGFIINSEKLKSYGISVRELEVLELMAKGLSNQEIANKLLCPCTP